MAKLLGNAYVKVNEPMSKLYGRQPALIPAGLKDLTYYVAGSLPKPPPSVAVPVVPNPGSAGGGGLWGMDGNDSKGNCGIAGLNHGFRADAALVKAKGYVPATAAQCLSYYATYDHNQDVGVVLSAYLTYVQKNKFYGSTIEGFAPVGYSDIPTLQFCIANYGFAYVGINVTDAMMQACEGATWQPWTQAMLSSPLDGGHCVILVGYDDEFLYCVTWGGVQKITYGAWHGMSDEAWAVITGTQVAANGDGRGVNLAALKSDISKLSK